MELVYEKEAAELLAGFVADRQRPKPDEAARRRCCTCPRSTARRKPWEGNWWGTRPVMWKATREG